MKTPFLKQVAHYYYDLYGREINRLKFVFASKRSQLFFRHYLAEMLPNPIFSPPLETINEFILSFNEEYTVLDDTSLLFELYEASIEGLQEPESFDEFLYWGQMILKDFDSIDRNLVQPREIFRNLYALKELEIDDLYQYMEPSLKELICSFWSSFRDLEELPEGEKNDYRRRFLSFWDRLPLIYDRFRKRLEQKKCAYEGMLYRLAAERASHHLEQLEEEQPIVVVGLYFLEQAEYKLLRTLKKKGTMSFCWDEMAAPLLDAEHPASLRMQQLIATFGQVNGPWARANFPKGTTFADLLPHKISLINTSSSIASTKVLPLILSEELSSSGGLETAVIVPNEKLLIPAVSSIPPSYQELNVTIGYPLSHTPIAVLVYRWIHLNRLARVTDGQAVYLWNRLSPLLSSALLSKLDPSLELFIIYVEREHKQFTLGGEFIKAYNKEYPSPILSLLERSAFGGDELLDSLAQLLELFKVNILSSEEEPIFSDFDQEFILHYVLLVERLKALLKEHNIKGLSKESVAEMLNGLTRMVKIPFEGDPLRGLQIMGGLEARNLSFAKMVMLSVEEGQLPKGSLPATIIPYKLLEAYGMPTIARQDEVDAYRFFSLISRCDHLVMVTADNKEDKLAGKEPSRFIAQMELLYGAQIERKSLQLPLTFSRSGRKLLDIPYSQALHQRLSQNLLRRPLSPSMLATLVECRLRFYYEYIENLREQSEADVLLDAASFGSIVHEVMHRLYKPYEGGGSIEPQWLEYLLRDGVELLRGYIREEYIQIAYPGSSPQRKRLEKKDLYYIQMLERYVRAILRYDQSIAPFIYIAGELKMEVAIGGQGNAEVLFRGIVDRIDIVDGKLRVVDYKTGGDKLEIKAFEELFSIGPSERKSKKVFFQTLLYAEMVTSGKAIERTDISLSLGLEIVPTVYKLRDMLSTKIEEIDPYLYDKGSGKHIVYDKETREAFLQLLKGVLEPLHSSGQETFLWEPTENQNICGYCPFRLSCGVHSPTR